MLGLSTDHELYVKEGLLKENDRLRLINKTLKVTTAILLEWTEHTDHKNEQICPKCEVEKMLNNIHLKFSEQ